MYSTVAIPLRSKSGFGLLASFVIVALSSFSSVGYAVTPPNLKVLRGGGQETTYAAAFPAPLVVWVTDPASERPVPGIRIHFTPGAGIGLSSSYAITDERGLASVIASGLAACISETSAEIVGFPDSKVIFDGLVVNKAVLTVLPLDLQSTAGGAVPAVTDYTIQGFVNGDTEETAEVSGAPVLTTTAQDHSHHANYAIKGGIGTLSAPNYAFVAGFGTLAVLGSPGSKSTSDTEQEASIALPKREDRVVVRAALMNQPAASLMQASSATGLRVHSVILQKITPAAASAQSASAKSAMPVMVAGIRKSSDVAPVRAVVLPKLSAATTAQSSDTRSAMLPAADDIRRAPGAPVRAAIDSDQAAAKATIQSSYAGSATRKALIPPGTN